MLIMLSRIEPLITSLSVRRCEHKDIKQILYHPQVFKWITYEGFKGEIPASEYTFVGDRDGPRVAWMFHSFCPGVLSMHIASLPKTLGVLDGSVSVIQILRDMDFKKIIAFIPEDNKLAIIHAVKLGFVSEGRSEDVWPRNGIHAINYYGLKLCQQ